MTTNLRVLMIVFNSVYRGTYWRAFHLGRHLVKKGHKVTLLTMSSRSCWKLQSYYRDGVNIVETPDLLWGPLRSGWDLWDTFRRVFYLRNRTYDLVHVFESRPTVIFPAIYMQKKGIPLIMDWSDWLGRGGSVEERPNPLIRSILRPVETFFEEWYRPQADGTVVICSTLYDKAVKLGVNPQNILCLQDGSDIENIVPLDKEASRRLLGLPMNAPIIGYIGAIFKKDAELMAKAFERIYEKLPSSRLLLIGYVNAVVEKMVSDQEAVIRTGFIDYGQINAYTAACDICWLPYTDSGANRGRWPLKLNDYMAAGRPTVATAVGDVTNVMKKHAIGALTEPDANDIADKSLGLLMDPEKCAQLGANAREAAENSFAWHFRAAELESFYEQTIDSFLSKYKR